MSKLNKNVFAVAIAAALVAPAAHAVTLTAGAGATVNQNQFASPTAAAAVATFTVAADATDPYLGRTVGYNVRVTLPAGVTIATGGTPTIAAAGGAASATLVAGTGAVGSNTFTVLVVPKTTPPAGTAVGEGFTASGLLIAGTSLANGGTVVASVNVVDPTTALPLATTSGSVLTAIQGVAVTYAPTTGTAVNKIDVGTPSLKRYLVASPYAVGAGSNALSFQAGNVVIGEATGVAAWLGTGATAAATATVTLTGIDFNPFKTSSAAGNTPAFVQLGGVAGTVSADGTSVTFPAVALSGGLPKNLSVVLNPNSVVAIKAQNIKASVVVTPAPTYSPFSNEGGLASLAFNGYEVKFQNVNPAGNPRAQSFVRLTNSSSVACPVTLSGVDDNGAASAGNVVTSIPVGASVTFNSEDLENGSSKGTGAFGDGAGRWVVTATAECATIAGSALNRNLDDGTVTNLTPSAGEL